MTDEWRHFQREVALIRRDVQAFTTKLRALIGPREGRADFRAERAPLADELEQLAAAAQELAQQYR